MPTIQYQIALGQTKSQITTATPSTFGTDVVRLQIDYSGAKFNRGELIRVLDQLRARILEGSWPPA
jgi:hypothetical protein